MELGAQDWTPQPQNLPPKRVFENRIRPTNNQAFCPSTNYTLPPKKRRAVHTVLLDKWTDGDPTKSDYFGTMYEYDIRETQLLFGGDLKALGGAYFNYMNSGLAYF